ncbi:Sensor histidine kinase regulating citrate/malate metabolism [Geodermatophilus dictyosporus]|uniref:histidine kinase n=1 Tax=Geodermatophilus dictyosporus TaxID=1523247 RepID=A0A1I5JGM3_9ACTN|nr:sensor histidine kinase [Geodermatophilus dictyosporus]SFO71915.1 Sensor histidine kinase regulating citrate/malate metabolism [Geodermatophilus dictyosporus]
MLTRRGRVRRGTSLARQLLWLQALVLLTVVTTATAVAYLDARSALERAAEQRTRAVVESLADSPLVVDAVAAGDATAVLQPFVEEVRADTGLSFITVMAPDRTRFTHPDPAQIGRPFVGTVAPALAGDTFSETYTGTLGPSLRTTGPVFGDGGEVVALVSAGLTVDVVGADLAEAVPGILGTAAVTLAVGALGSWAVSRRLRRQTGGLDATTMAALLEHHEAVLHAVREGLLLLDRDGRVTLANDEARRLLDLDGDPAGRRLDELGLPPELAAALGSPERGVDEVHLTDTRVLLVNRSPARSAGRSGSVVTLRDHTELQALTGERDSVRAFAESLRAQAHEAANRLHATVSLVELGRSREAVEFATAQLAAAQELTDRVVGAVEEPVLAALLLGKAATAAERGVRLDVDPGTSVGATGIPGGDLVTVVGNLLDNAIDAALAGEPPREVQVGVWDDGDRLEIRVEDSGPGLAEEDVERVFRRGWSTKADPDGAPAGLGRGLGLALVQQVVRRHGGTVGVRPGPGAEFRVSIPLSVPAGAPR